MNKQIEQAITLDTLVGIAALIAAALHFLIIPALADLLEWIKKRNQHKRNQRARENHSRNQRAREQDKK